MKEQKGDWIPIGGAGGIRTHGRFYPPNDFESGAVAQAEYGSS